MGVGIKVGSSLALLTSKINNALLASRWKESMLSLLDSNGNPSNVSKLYGMFSLTLAPGMVNVQLFHQGNT
jgi:hypothetical protein